MSETKSKLKRIQQLKRVRNIQFDQEVQILSQIRGSISLLEQQLAKLQQDYLRGVNMLNQARNSSERNYLEALESGLDFTKGKWQRMLHKINELKSLEKAQLAQTQLAQKNLKTMEKLQDKQISVVNKEELSKEQKSMDEIANKRFHQNMH